MPVKLYDMHCHLDFAPNAAEATREIEALGVGAFAVSVLPNVKFGGGAGAPPSADASASLVKWGAGLHPWWVASGRTGAAELDTLLAAIPSTKYIGEVGLDFGKKYLVARDIQQGAFGAIAQACAAIGGRVLSIHSVHAANTALDILETSGALKNCTCIFHWFSDSGEAFTRAVQAGCYFSVGALMLRSARGREYARQIPYGQLLLETDEPPQGQPYDVAAMQKQLAETLNHIAELKKTSNEELGAIVATNSAALLSCNAS